MRDHFDTGPADYEVRRDPRTVDHIWVRIEKEVIRVPLGAGHDNLQSYKGLTWHEYEMLYDDMMPLHYEDWYLPQLDGSAPAAPAEPETPAASAKVPDELVGSWEHSSGYTYVFAADGTGSYGRGDSKMDFTFTVEGDQLSILYTGSTSPFVTTYRIEGTTLIILDSFNSEVKYEKK